MDEDGGILDGESIVRNDFHLLCVRADELASERTDICPRESRLSVLGFDPLEVRWDLIRRNKDVIIG